MRVRKQDANGDYAFGGGQASIWTNVPDGVAQVVMTRLRLFQGEWFLDTRQGTAWNTRVLGKYTGSTRDMVIRSRILGTPGVTQIAAYSSNLNRDTRAYSVNATIDTAYGAAKVTGPI